MESVTLTGPLLYMIIAWGIFTTAFILLFIWRSVLSSHEDDQIFLDAAMRLKSTWPESSGSLWRRSTHCRGPS